VRGSIIPDPQPAVLLFVLLPELLLFVGEIDFALPDELELNLRRDVEDVAVRHDHRGVLPTVSEPTQSATPRMRAG
jgi:hypothetical protein